MVPEHLGSLYRSEFYPIPLQDMDMTGKNPSIRSAQVIIS
jgi:hypothetical protein